MSLQEFIDTNRTRLISMCREKVAKRGNDRRPKSLEATHGVDAFLRQLREELIAEAKGDPAARATPDPPTNPNIANTATLHGHDLLALGFSVDEVVHDYGDVCQAVTELAVELNATVSVADFHTLNRCLDNAIAAAVTAWSAGGDPKTAAPEGQPVSKDEQLRRLVNGSIRVFELLRGGRVAPGGATGTILVKNLEMMRALLDISVS